MTVVLGIGVRNGRLTGTQRGAGVACVGASPKLVDCRIIGNAGGIQGGGLYCENASPVLERTSLTGNASQFGGGIYAKGVSGPRLVGCTLSGNLADVDGGGLFSASLVQIHLQRTILSGNCADGEGDEAYLFSPSSDLALTCSLVDDSGVEGQVASCTSMAPSIDDPRFAPRRVVSRRRRSRVTTGCGPTHRRWRRTVSARRRSGCLARAAVLFPRGPVVSRAVAARSRNRRFV
ncbi:MAG: hypothetical protein IPK72_22815 [Candidatus Eisenbacteria bacterium]|nr:hypothetical protein [Candidatus Eisenbacteria bacterium]